MKYNTPELLLIGAAQNFVLGASDTKGPFQNADDPTSSNPQYQVLQLVEVEW